MEEGNNKKKKMADDTNVFSSMIKKFKLFQEKPPPRRSAKFCYAFAILGVLRYANEFREMIDDSESTSDFACDIKRLIDPQTEKDETKRKALENIIGCIQSMDSTFSPEKENDCHVFYLALLEFLGENSGIPHLKDAIKKNFGINLEGLYICCKCNHKYVCNEFCYSLFIKPHAIPDGELKVLDAENLFGKTLKDVTCENCESSETTLEVRTLQNQPEILLFHIQRAQDSSDISKRRTPLNYGDRLYVVSQDCRLQVTYFLFGVIFHRELSTSCGHYYSYVKDFDGKWKKCEQGIYTDCNEREPFHPLYSYMLFYKKE